MFEAVEEALDEVALPIEGPFDASLGFPIAAGRDVSPAALCGDEVDQGHGVVASIGDEVPARRKAFDQSRGERLVGRLSGREHDPDGQTTPVHKGMDLGGQPSARAANGVIRTPLFPPAACWWARTIEESMRWSDCGERSAKAAKMPIHTPRFAQRLKRL